MKNINFIIFLIPIVSLYARKCPPDWNPSPCFCTEDPRGYHGFIKCNKTSDINSTADLIKIFHCTTGINRDLSLLIEDANLEYLNETAIFNNFQFDHIAINRTKTKWISNDALKGQNSVAQIEFSNNEFERFNFDAVHSRNVRYLSVTKNQLVEILPDSFNPATYVQLHVINLSFNKLRVIHKLTFSNLPRLRTIVLTGNEITTIEEQAFHLVARYEPLGVFLEQNNLTSNGIQRNAFPAGLKLRTLDLSRNHLTSLPMHIFEPILEVMADIAYSSLEVSGNPFVCDISLYWLVRKPERFKNIVKGMICPNGKTLNELTVDDLEN